MEIGDSIDETGLLLREGSGFYLRRDGGGRYSLSLRRVPVDEVEKQVRVIGHYAGDGLIDVDGIQLALPALAPDDQASSDSSASSSGR